MATSGQTGHVAPLTAVELLLILHKMEGTSVKPSIEAISLCLAEKQVFTFEGNILPSVSKGDKKLKFSFRNSHR